VDISNLDWMTKGHVIGFFPLAFAPTFLDLFRSMFPLCNTDSALFHITRKGLGDIPFRCIHISLLSRSTPVDSLTKRINRNWYKTALLSDVKQGEVALLAYPRLSNTERATWKTHYDAKCGELGLS
jgi:hypothetical protein